MNDAGFERWLDLQLPRHAYAYAGSRPLPAQARYQAITANGEAHLPLLLKVGAALTTKTAMAVAAGALAVGAAGASERAITGSANPSDWGKQVVQQVNDCKAALAPGSHGIGQCVSSFAKQHGKSTGDDHRATPSPAHGAQAPSPPKGKSDAAAGPRSDRPAHARKDPSGKKKGK